jgi:hypothetical protein
VVTFAMQPPTIADGGVWTVSAKKINSALEVLEMIRKQLLPGIIRADVESDSEFNPCTVLIDEFQLTSGDGGPSGTIPDLVNRLEYNFVFVLSEEHIERRVALKMAGTPLVHIQGLADVNDFFAVRCGVDENKSGLSEPCVEIEADLH